METVPRQESISNCPIRHRELFNGIVSLPNLPTRDDGLSFALPLGLELPADVPLTASDVLRLDVSCSATGEWGGHWVWHN
jgi:hypothetical protein